MAVPEHYPLTLTVIGKTHILSGDQTGLIETLQGELLETIKGIAIPKDPGRHEAIDLDRHEVIEPRRRRRKSPGLNYSCTQILRAMGEYKAEITLGRLSDMTDRKTSTISSVLSLLIGRTMATRKGNGVYEITERGREYLLENPPRTRVTPPPPPPYIRHQPAPPSPPEPAEFEPEPPHQHVPQAPAPPRQEVLKPLGRPRLESLRNLVDREP